MPTHRIKAISAVAARWQDPEYAVRAEAVERMLAGPKRFTEEGLAFAINHLMHHITEEVLAAHVDAKGGDEHTFQVNVANEAPLALCPALLAVVLSGHRAQFRVKESSACLVRAFWNEISEEAGDVWVSVDEEGESDRTIPVIAISAYRTIAILDGNEKRQERENLAEDVLLHDGQADENVALIWAPLEVLPDRYIHTFAEFRSIFPAHDRTMGALKMQQAFLKAQNTPHAYGEGLEFLMSKGAPKIQPEGHVRWVAYTSLQEVEAWLRANTPHIASVVSRKPFLDVPDVQHLDVGMAHRQPWFESVAWREAKRQITQVMS